MNAKFEIGQKVYTVLDSKEVEIQAIYLTKEGVFYKINACGSHINVGENELAESYKDAQRECFLRIQKLKEECEKLIVKAEAMGITIGTEKK